MMEHDLLRFLMDAGTGAALAALVLVGLYRTANRLGGSFIDAQRGQAEALGKQAQALEGLTASVRDVVKRDSSEHREILVLLRFIAQQQRSLEEVRLEHNVRKKQAHPHCGAGAPQDTVPRRPGP